VVLSWHELALDEVFANMPRACAGHLLVAFERGASMECQPYDSLEAREVNPMEDDFLVLEALRVAPRSGEEPALWSNDNRRLCCWKKFQMLTSSTVWVRLRVYELDPLELLRQRGTRKQRGNRCGAGSHRPRLLQHTWGRHTSMKSGR
jgi:hypothetical protein